jgi:hypothetical protein
LIENKSGESIVLEPSMEGIGPLVVVVAVLIANVPAVMQQWRTDRPGSIKTLWLMGIYALYVALGIWLLFRLIPEGGTEPGKALFATGLMVGWIFYGALTLMRVVPRYREPPGWLMRFGVADILLLGLMFGCLAAYLWT